MVRGRRKQTIQKRLVESDSKEDINGGVDGPKKKDIKIEFKGHLAHSSPQTPIKSQMARSSPCSSPQTPITNYFSVMPVPASPSADINSPSLVDDNVTSPQHKIQMVDMDASNNKQTSINPLTPSSALSRLRISLSPNKKLLSPRSANAAPKSRRRLNPSQSQNQQPPPPQVDMKPPAPQLKVKVKEEKNNHKLTEYFPVRRSVRRTKKTLMEERHRSIEDAVLSGKEEGLEVHHFPGKGRGIVATRLFTKGEFVVEYAGELIDTVEARLREQRYSSDQNTGCYMYYFKYRNQQHCIDATAETSRLGRLVNHSRIGNLVTRTVLIKNQPHLVLVARNDIVKGEEVLYDYGDRSKESLQHHPWLAS